MSETVEINRLRWQCRRGMLELDLLLFAFLENEYPSLDREARKDFATLLEFPDQTLQSWLISDSKIADKQMVEIVQIIRQGGRDLEAER
ncbi:succinate dehydrogenase assembly factor 2 [endosymbiont of Lamellibrachia barhami]|uniref:FAD assembly factor SdhE n=1 Tax=endosymbiont of Lamellibrachia barhami TaxID=205975 RepID=UPI001FE4C114|nr:succinate dehydrogenase assembly factor 2 [endosymbiont of Lamellibrachia barhami]